MEAFVSEVLTKIDGNPERLGELFGKRLSTREELMLTKLDEDIARVVEQALERALTGAHGSQEILIDQRGRDRVMELTAFRRALLALIKERGSLAAWRDGLN
jgi:hypothetical protein